MKRTLSKAAATLKRHSVSERDARLLETVKRDLLPPDHKPRENYVPKRRLGSAGVELNAGRQLELLRSFQQPEFQSLFEVLRNQKEINPGFGGTDYMSRGLIHNGFYPTPDAELYAAMIAATRPETVIEVGSGYSTVIARASVEHLDLKTRIHVIDPEPRRDIESFADHIEYRPVEQSALADHAFDGSTLLFIDSSHVCRSDGDLPFLYNKLIPSLPAGVLIHIHDVFLPFDYPDNYFERFYTEQYLLHALLAHSRKYEVILATHYLAREHREVMQELFGSAVGENPLFFGASFWIKCRE